MSDAQPTVQPGGYGASARLANALLTPYRALGGLSLSAQGLLRGASRVSGLPELDPNELREPLEALCADLEENPLTPLGSAFARATLVEALSSRRRLQAAELGRPTTPPVVLVGWYRTGTTYLQNLLGALPDYQYVPLFRLMNPLAGRSARWKVVLGTKIAGFFAPELRAIHHVTADTAEECWALLITHLVADGLAIHWDLPRFHAWLQSVDRRRVYRTWEGALAQLEKDLGSGLVMKDPAHMMGLGAIADVLETPQMVWTHRDPAESLASFGSLVAIQHRTVTGRYDPHRAGRVCLERMATYLQRGMAAREQLPPGSLFDLKYGDLVAEPVASVEAIADHFGLRFDADAVQARVKARRPKKGAKHVYNLAQWGLDRQQIQAALPHYPDSWWTD